MNRALGEIYIKVNNAEELFYINAGILKLHCCQVVMETS